MRLCLRKTLIIIAVAALTSGFIYIRTASAFFDNDDRTANRSAQGMEHRQQLFQTPEHYEFSSQISNRDEQVMHPEAWSGQFWDTDDWSKEWTPKRAADNFFEAGIFTKRYLKLYQEKQDIVKDGVKRRFFVSRKKKYVPVLELGSVFYKLSDLDQRRTLRTLMEQSRILEKGHEMVILLDWHTKEVVGSYSAEGMFLN